MLIKCLFGKNFDSFEQESRKLGKKYFLKAVQKAKPVEQLARISIFKEYDDLVIIISAC